MQLTKAKTLFIFKQNRKGQNEGFGLRKDGRGGKEFYSLFSEQKLKIMIDRSEGTNKVVKTFVLEDETTKQSTIVDHEIQTKSQLVNLNPILDHHCPLADNRVSIYDPNSGAFEPLTALGLQNGIISKEMLEPDVVLIRFVNKVSFVDGSQSLEQSCQQQEGRSKERTIGEVLEVVKKWRYLHHSGHPTLKKRLNLQEAAKLVGVSKKSLDDYYCQLRLGESYNFDFVNNLDEKIGVLRNFVRDFRPQKKQSKRKQNDKHPRKLRIIDFFDISNHCIKVESDRQNEEREMLNIFQPIMIRSPDVRERQEFESEKECSVDNLSCLGMMEKEGGQKIMDLEHDFFKDFDGPFGEICDPYFEGDQDFWKKDLEVNSDSFMFMD